MTDFSEPFPYPHAKTRQEHDENRAWCTAYNIEYCSRCYKKLDFPMSISIHDPRRYANGGHYYEGGGQACGGCHAAIERFRLSESDRWEL